MNVFKSFTMTRLLLSLIAISLTAAVIIFHSKADAGPDGKVPDTFLTGVVKVEDFYQPPYRRWFDANFQDYIPNSDTASSLKNKLADHQIKVFMGTWCHDSKREVPRLIRLLDDIQFDMNNLEIIALDLDKQSPDGAAKNAEIRYTPTFIVYKDNSEVGRIVEKPTATLEADLLEIVSK